MSNPLPFNIEVLEAFPGPFASDSSLFIHDVMETGDMC
jgi:hypothetical protein